MANESTAASISAFINAVFEDALLAARDMTIVAPLVKGFNDRTGLASRYNSLYTGGTVATITEATDMASQTFTPGTISVLTPAQVGTQYFITDLRLESDTMNVRADAARDLGELAAVSLDTSLVGTFSSLTGGTVGTAGGTLSWTDIAKAITALRGRNFYGPYTCVLHPSQWHYLTAVMLPGSTITNMPALQNAIAGQFYVGSTMGVNFYTDANITSGTAATAAMFKSEAIAYDIRRGMRIEPQRDASRGGGGWELNMTFVYASGVWRPNAGIKMIGTSVIS